MSDTKAPVSLRHQLLRGFGISSSIPLGLFLIACNCFLYFQSQTIQNDANSSLFGTAASELSTINTAAANSFNDYLTYSSFTTVLIASTFSGDLYRSDFPFNSSVLFRASPWSYFCSIFPLFDVEASPNICINSPLITDTRSGGGMISLSSSAVSIPSYLYSGDETTFSSSNPSAYTTIGRSATLDLFNSAIYQRESSFSAFLMGFYNDGPGLYRRYPADPRNISDGEAYDPRSRPWFQAVPRSNSVSPRLYFTAPYYNAFTGTPQTSVSSGVYNAITGQFEAVYSGTLELGDLINRLAQIQFEGSYGIVFDKQSGLVVARTNNTAASSPGLISYSQLTLPVISYSLWQSSIFPVSASSPSFINAGDYLVRISLLYLNGSQSLLLTNFLPKSVLDAQIAPVSSAVSSDLHTFLIAVNVAFGVILVLVIGVILCVTDKLSRPLEKLSNASTQLVKNLGSNDLTAGVELAVLGKSIPRTNSVSSVSSANSGQVLPEESISRVQVLETRQLQSQFVEMIHAIEENRKEALAAGHVDNAFLKNPQQTPWYERLGPPPPYAPGRELSKQNQNKRQNDIEEEEEKKRSRDQDEKREGQAAGRSKINLEAGSNRADEVKIQMPSGQHVNFHYSNANQNRVSASINGNSSVSAPPYQP